MDSLTAFAAIGLTAVAWDGSLTPAGGRAFRHALDYREPYCSLGEHEMVDLMDCALAKRWRAISRRWCRPSRPASRAGFFLFSACCL